MQKRNIWGILGLYIITLGFYHIYWLYKVRNEIVAHSGDPKSVPPFAHYLMVMLGLIALIILSGVVSASSDGTSATPAVMGLLVLLASLAVIVYGFWWTYRLCHTAAVVTHGMEVSTSFIIFVICVLFGVPLIWLLLVQNDINRAVDREAAGGTPPTSVTPSQPPVAPTPPVVPTPPTSTTPPAAPQV